MLPRLFLLPLLLSVLFLVACGDDIAEENKEPAQQEVKKRIFDQKIDEETDIILGDKDAPHEMVAYFSPGCIHCLKLYSESFPEIKSKYIDTGDIRYVIRAVPNILPLKKDEDGKVTRFNIAKEHSNLIATTLRCTDHYKRPEAYYKAFDTVIEAVNIGKDQDPSAIWPYYGEEAIKKTFYHIGRYGQLSPEEYETCIKDPLQSQFSKVFMSNDRMLTRTFGIKTLPAYFIDGEYIEFTSNFFQKEALLKKLDETIK